MASLTYFDNGLVGTGTRIFCFAKNRSSTNRRIRSALRSRLTAVSGVTFYFLPADFAANDQLRAPAPFDIQFGGGAGGKPAVAGRFAEKLRKIPALLMSGPQPADLPRRKFAVGRIKGSDIGLTHREIATSLC